jgi:hypothetical protein
VPNGCQSSISLDGEWSWTARQRLVLGPVKVAEKSNEIVAIPKLLNMLTIGGAIITIEAMECQRDIAQQVIDKKADYVATGPSKAASTGSWTWSFATMSAVCAPVTPRPISRPSSTWPFNPLRRPAGTASRVLTTTPR